VLVKETFALGLSVICEVQTTTCFCYCISFQNAVLKKQSNLTLFDIMVVLTQTNVMVGGELKFGVAETLTGNFMQKHQ